VLVNLERHPAAGGHVKCWERFSEAACGLEGLDLTVYFLGRRQTVALADNVRFEIVPGILNTRSLVILKQGGGHADIAPFNPRLARMLGDRDVLHATDVFSFGATAARIAARRGLPLVYSVHTAHPQYGRIYFSEIVRRLFGRTVGRMLTEGLGADRIVAEGIERRLVRLLKVADRVLAVRSDDLPPGIGPALQGKLATLRRGVDTTTFAPELRDRGWLEARFGIAPERPVCLFVGRIDDTKNVLTVLETAKILAARGVSAHWLFVGEGLHRPRIAAQLGALAAPGALPQSELPRIYASSDILVFPSRLETCGQVVLEAKASGLPCVVSAHHATAQHIAVPGRDGVIVDDPSAGSWADAVARLVSGARARRAMADAARVWAENECPSWQRVLEEDLVPVWRGLTTTVVSAAA
jgi:glycosyltransferase involved in cell wall biosynthesis